MVKFAVFKKNLPSLRTRVGHWNKKWVPRKKMPRESRDDVPSPECQRKTKFLPN